LASKFSSIFLSLPLAFVPTGWFGFWTGLPGGRPLDCVGVALGGKFVRAAAWLFGGFWLEKRIFLAIWIRRPALPSCNRGNREKRAFPGQRKVESPPWLFHRPLPSFAFSRRLQPVSFR